MKKGVVIALACLLLFSACGQQTEKPENSEKPQETVGPIMQEEKVSSLYDSPNNGSEGAGGNNSESNEERLIRIAKNVCADLYHTTQEGGLQIRQPEYQGNECHIYTYTPGNTGPTLFVEFIFDVGGNAETAIADFWGERTAFRSSDYDKSGEKSAEPKLKEQKSQDAIGQIQHWYAQTEQNASKLEGEVFGTSASAYWLDGELVKAEYYIVTDVLDGTLTGTGYTLTCYYQDATPYFAHVLGYGKLADLDVILYFWDGKIIRWFGKDGQHEGSNAEYEKYYDQTLQEYDNVQKARGGGIPIK